MSPLPLARLRTAVLLAAGFLGALGALAGAPPPPEGRISFKAFSLEDGLGNQSVWSLLQDRTGFLWVGTEDGLYRFDGNQFKGFGSKEGLPSHYVESLHQGPDGTLWAGTIQGLARLRGGRFEQVALAGGGPQPEISAIVTGGRDRIMVATPLGPYAQDAAGGFQPLPDWPGGAATSLWASARDERVAAASWLQNRARVLVRDRGVWRELTGPGLGPERIDDLELDGQGRLWARSLQGLWVLDPGAAQFRAVPVPPAQQKGHLAVDAAGELWVTTIQGLVRFGRGGSHLLTRKDGLPEAGLNTSIVDREGSLWVAGSGVYRLRGGGAWRAYAQDAGLPPGAVWSVFKDRDGQRYAGTDRGLYQATAGNWRLVPGTQDIQVRSIVQAADGALFLSGSPVILRWDPRTKALRRFGPAEGVRSGGRILKLLFSPDGALWVATEKGGLLRGVAQGGAWTFTHQDVAQGSAQETFRDLCLDTAGRLWAGGYQGLAVLDGGIWKRFTVRDGLRNDGVTYLYATADGAVRFTYFEPLGLAEARLEQGVFRLVRHFDDQFAPDKVIYLMGGDAAGNFWLGTGQGIDRITANQQVEHFSRADGLVSEDINALAFLAEPGGDVWFGTSFGLARFEAPRYLGTPPPPPTVLLSSGLERARPSTFEAAFAALSYVKEGALHYETRLVGLEAQWHETDTREARYPALAPGKYRFEVRARIGRGEWGPAAGVEFRVLPTWWQSWWFRTLAGLGGLGLLGLGTWARMAALERRNRLLGNMVEERTRELAEANERFRNQSLTDPLTGLRNRRYLGVCMPDDVAQVNRIHRTALKQGSERLAANLDMIFIMVDLDHFKDVNDRYGHAAGDLVLQEVAVILRAATRDSDTIVRWGGEEFLVVARNACREDATIVMERIRAQVAAHAFILADGREIRCTCSLGFTFYPLVRENPDLVTWERVVDLADHCLYAAKRGSRNAWVGLYPAADADVELLRDRLQGGIGELVWKHQLEVRTSLDADIILEWDGNA